MGSSCGTAWRHHIWWRCTMCAAGRVPCCLISFVWIDLCCCLQLKCPPHLPPECSAFSFLDPEICRVKDVWCSILSSSKNRKKELLTRSCNRDHTNLMLVGLHAFSCQWLLEQLKKIKSKVWKMICPYKPKHIPDAMYSRWNANYCVLEFIFSIPLVRMKLTFVCTA